MTRELMMLEIFPELLPDGWHENLLKFIDHKSRVCSRKKWTSNNAEYFKEYRKRTEYSDQHIARILSAVKSRAKKLQVDFDLDVDWWNTNYTGFCPILGIKLEFGNDDRWSSPSIDRMYNKNYIKTNCRIVSNRFNTLKGNLCDEELVAICKIIVEKLTNA